MLVARQNTRGKARSVSPQKLAIPSVEERVKRTYINQFKRNDQHPAKIVDNVYLGSVGAAYSLPILKNLGITHILTVCEVLPPLFPNEFVYKVVQISDEPQSRLSAHFRDCLEFIHNAVQHNGNILIHCFAGVSRSATITIAYLMRYHKMDLRRAFTYVKSKRAWINPNPGFMVQLRRYNDWLKRQRDEGKLE